MRTQHKRNSPAYRKKSDRKVEPTRYECVRCKKTRISTPSGGLCYQCRAKEIFDRREKADEKENTH